VEGQTMKMDTGLWLGLVLLGIWLSVSEGAEALRLTVGTHDLGGEVLRCGPGVDVGLHVAGTEILVRNAIVQGCPIGVLVTGHDARVSGIEVRNTSVGIWLAGDDSLAEHNIVGEVGFGFVVTGDENTLRGNRSNDNTHLGYLITGQRNLLEQNEARWNGQGGIYIASMVPLVDGFRVLPFLRTKGLGNVMRGNTALESGQLDIAEFDGECDENTWESDNIFGTSDIPGPCPPEENEVVRR
jgi:Right handed beta helix region